MWLTAWPQLLLGFPEKKLGIKKGGGKGIPHYQKGCCAPLGLKQGVFLQPWEQRGVLGWESAGSCGAGGLWRAVAAGIIRQKLICKENLAAVRRNIDFVFVCFLQGLRNGRFRQQLWLFGLNSNPDLH